MATASTNVRERSRPMTGEEKKVILASSAGTIFEWYDFYLYGSLAAIIGAQFFTPFPEATRNVFALLAFAAGFIVRPFGALVFGMLGDLIGRKYTFLVALLHKSSDDRGYPFPGRTYPTASVTGMPSAVKPFRTATRTWNSAT